MGKSEPESKQNKGMDGGCIGNTWIHYQPSNHGR
jgi:hypothetical protein